MALNFILPYSIPPIMLLPPAADAAGRTSPYRNCRSVDKLYVVCHVNQGNAAQVTLSLSQATSVTGTGAKALLAGTPVWLNDATAVSDAYTALGIQPAAGYQLDNTIADKIVIFEVNPSACMDVANGYKCIAVTTSASNAANITEAKLFPLTDYHQQTPLTTYSN